MKTHRSERNLKAAARQQTAAEERKALLLELDAGESFQKHEPILESVFHPNDAFTRDDFYGPFDSYDMVLLSPPPPKAKKDGIKERRRGPRVAGFLPWKSPPKYDWNLTTDFKWKSHFDDDSKDENEFIDENMTTPLHEACRIASPDFVGMLLGLGGNPNVRNGLKRTALHMVAGGLLATEIHGAEKETSAPDAGIRKPIIDTNEDEDGDQNSRGMHKVAVRAVGRLFHKTKANSDCSAKHKPHEASPLSIEEHAGLTSRRMDTLLAVMSWVHPDDGTPSSGEGLTVNSVDSRGRTALHYAAELGRADLCLTILTSFGAMLTVVDESGRTPCELAAEQRHPELTAQLEARALLYTDPYGMDEDLMADVWGASSDDEQENGESGLSSRKARLTPPFSWFETWKSDDVRRERQNRTVELLEEMKNILAVKQEEKEAMEFMYNYGVDDSTMEEETLSSVPKLSCSDSEKDGDYNEVVLPAEDEAGKTAETLISGNKEKANLMVEANCSVEDDDEQSGGESPPKEPEIPVQPILGEEDLTTASKEAVLLLDPSNGDFHPAALSESAKADDASLNRLNKIAKNLETPEGTKLSDYQIVSRIVQNFHAERLAAYHLWDIAAAVKSFKCDPVQSLLEAGVQVPEVLQLNEFERPAVRLCLICCDEFNADSNVWKPLSNCDHSFCRGCLGDYVSECARSKETGIRILCPHHECSSPLLEQEVEELSPSEDIFQSLLSTSDEIFVSSASDLRFCPHPGCDGVVRRILPTFILRGKVDRNLVNLTGAVCTANGDDDAEAPLTYEGVSDKRYKLTRNTSQPKRAHRFCFSCGSLQMHWPLQCAALDEWKEQIARELGELGQPDGENDPNNFNDVAQRLWMKANTRPCPKCKAPIEKNDGCNHMTCSNRNCRHEFCWICREDWKLHNTETGGFFRCNRWQGDESHEYYDTPPPPEQRTPETPTSTAEALAEANYGTALHSARVAWKKSTEMKLFLHHYRRWTAHSESAALERQMAETVCTRLAPVVEAAIEFNGHDHFDFGGRGLSFIHAAFSELLECRSLLQYSYPFAFFRYPIQYHIRRNRIGKTKEREKLAFEQLQSELEMLTEQMSDIVARKHIRATQLQIMFLTNSTCLKRHELTSFMLSLLNEQLKEAKQEAERAEKEKSRPMGDRPPLDTDSIFNIPHRPFSALEGPTVHHTHDQLSERLRQLVEHQHSQQRIPAAHDNMNSANNEVRLASARRSIMELAEEDETLRASLHAFITGAQNGGGRHSDWACPECTYMNAGGRRCAMCGTARR
jgi:hypothetical protein